MSSDWWSAKLAGQTPRPSAYPAPIQQQPQQAAPPAVSTASTNPAKAQHLRQDTTCPECGGGDYFRATPSTAPRCYDCGYPIIQTTSGMAGMGKGEGPVTPARQPTMGTGFNPTMIVERLG